MLALEGCRVLELVGVLLVLMLVCGSMFPGLACWGVRYELLGSQVRIVIR